RKYEECAQALADMEKRALMAESMVDAYTAAMANTTSSSYKEQVQRRQTRTIAFPGEVTADEHHNRSNEISKPDSQSGRVGSTSGRITQGDRSHLVDVIFKVSEANMQMVGGSSSGGDGRGPDLPGISSSDGQGRSSEQSVTPKHHQRKKWSWRAPDGSG
ncbi:hypothetical protein CBR_g78520, partial [Chara braunii]